MVQIYFIDQHRDPFCLVFQSAAEIMLIENAAQAHQMSPRGEKDVSRESH